jgi:hypothetical protein
VPSRQPRTRLHLLISFPTPRAGNAFTKQHYFDAAIVLLVGAMMLEQNDEWAVYRRYMQLEALLSPLGCPKRRVEYRQSQPVRADD